MKIYGISFDLWDTLIFDSMINRTSKINRYVELLSSYGLTEKDILSAYKYRFPEEDATQGKKTKAMTVDSRVNVLFHKLKLNKRDSLYLAQSISDISLAYLPIVAPEVITTLNKLSSILPLAIISNTRWTYGTTSRKILEKLQLDSYFKSAVFSEEIGWAKPAPQLFIKAWSSLGIDPAKTIHIGDSLNRDHQGLKITGGKSIVSRVINRCPEKGEFEADAICWNYKDLLVLIHYFLSGTLPCQWQELTQGIPISGTLVAGEVFFFNKDPNIPSGCILVFKELVQYDIDLHNSPSAILLEWYFLEKDFAQILRFVDIVCIIAVKDFVYSLNNGQHLLLDGRSGKIWRENDIEN